MPTKTSRKKKAHKNRETISHEIPSSEEQLIQEELGLYLHSDQKGKASTLEVTKSKHPKVSMFNDIDLNKWREYTDIKTDSLWLMDGRSRSGAHTAGLHGNFIPQIPHQAML